MGEARESLKRNERKKHSDRESWLADRLHGIGASEAAAIVGLSPWQTATGLWEEKVNRAESENISDDEAVSRGVRLEPVIRDLFKAVHPEFETAHHPYDMLFQKERPWLFATLDGELTETETGRMGILEIKTAAPTGKAGWSKWDNLIPPQYYTQLLHQLMATGYDFAVLYAALFGNDGNISIREYWLERDDCEEDMAWLVLKEQEFWDSVVREKLPTLSITF